MAWLEVCTKTYKGFRTFELNKRNEIGNTTKILIISKTVIDLHCLFKGKNQKQLIN